MQSNQSNAPIGVNSYGQTTGTISTSPLITVLSTRNPTTYDFNYPVKQRWINTVAASEFILTGFTNVSGENLALWLSISNESKAINFLTGNSGGPGGDDVNNNINVKGDGTTISIAGNPATNTLTVSAISGGAPSLMITTYNSGSGNWTANPATLYVKMWMFAGGGGGGSGRKGSSTASSGGGGGGAGQIVYTEGPVSAYSGTIAYVIGTGGAGAAAQSTNATNGSNGTAGNNSSFGTTIALGGGGGGGGTTVAGAAVNGVNGSFLWGAYENAGTSGAGSLTAGFTANNIQIIYGYLQPTSGGGGGGGDTATARAGGTGGGYLDNTGANIVAPAAGGIETGTINGANGAAAYGASGVTTGGFGGGGGGGAKSGTTGGIGGNGSAPGGGGGGGGGGISSQANSGAGGSGAGGQIVIIEYF